MARTREFDREAALEAAMELFWEQGFESTSVEDLVERLGISRASLYAAFGSKGGLLGAALDRYAARSAETTLSVLSEPGPVRAVLRRFFDRLVDAQCATGGRACLAVKCALSPVGREPETAARLGRIEAAMEDAFLRLLRRGRAAGELDPALRPREVARFLTSTVQGIAVTASTRPERRVLRSIARSATSVLDVRPSAHSSR